MSIKEDSSTSYNYKGEVDSPFLNEKLSVGESEEELGPRAVALAAESPFQSAFEQQQAGMDRHSGKEERKAMIPRQADSGAKDAPAGERQGHVSEEDETIDEFVQEGESPFSGYDEEEEPIYDDTVHEEWEDFSEAEETGDGAFVNETFFESEVSIDVKRAVVQNKRYGKKLKWDAQAGKIESFLMSALGLSSIATAEDFARAVATWQRGRGDKKPDGVIGPNTWAKLQSAMKAASPPPVSPSQTSPTALSNADKDVNELAIEIYESEYITLEAWESALNEFGEVMKAVSDAEGTADFSVVLKKYIEDKLLDTIAEQSKVVSAAKGVLDALVAENLRAEQAREGAQLRDFIVRFARAITKKKIDLSAAKADYFALVRRNYEGMLKADREAYKKQLVEYADRLDQRREDGWLTSIRLFRLFAFEWIRNTKKAFLRRDNVIESLVRVWVDKDDKIQKVRINAPGGQKIAEQFLKDAEGAGLRPYEWQVRRIILYFLKSDWPNATSRFTAEDKWDTRSESLGTDNKGIANRRFKRLLAQRPTTKDVKGE